jgi:ssDNA-binding Zn-finger/Zn-ribbon topoisomerase 1
MGRTSNETCPRCGNEWSQDWECEIECPRCGWPFDDEQDGDEEDEIDSTEI